MNVIHLASPTGERSTCNEGQLRSLWGSEQLVEGTRYWQSGMAEWRPVAEFFHGPASAVAPSTPPPLPSPRYAYMRDPRSLTRFLVAMLWIQLGMEVVSLLGDFAQLALLAREYTEAEAEMNDLRQGIIGFVYFGVYLVTAITFLRWIHRAAKNSRGFGADDMTCTPGWSVGYYFVPLVNLVRPYQAMKEIWQVSRNPSEWRDQPGGAVLNWWWMLWIFSAIVSQISFRMAMDASTVPALQANTWISVVDYTIGILLCLVAIKLVKSIADNQERLVDGALPDESLRYPVA